MTLIPKETKGNCYQSHSSKQTTNNADAKCLASCVKSPLTDQNLLHQLVPPKGRFIGENLTVTLDLIGRSSDNAYSWETYTLRQKESVRQTRELLETPLTDLTGNLFKTTLLV